MLKIRLKRVGKKDKPHYRIIVIPARTKREGKAIEYIGYYNPLDKKVDVKLERAKYWLSVGAQPTDTVRSILAKHKIIEPLQRPKRPPKKPKKELKKKKVEKKETKKKEEKVKKVKKKVQDKQADTKKVIEAKEDQKKAKKTKKDTKKSKDKSKK